MIIVINISLIVAEHEEERDIEEEEVEETDEGRRGSGANDFTWASQPVRNRLSAHVKFGARGDDEE